MKPECSVNQSFVIILSHPSCTCVKNFDPLTLPAKNQKLGRD